MSYFPFFVEIGQKRCLVVGGGTVAFRKIEKLLPFGVEITVVSPSFCAEIEQTEGICRIRKEFQAEDVEDMCFVIGATDCEAVTRGLLLSAMQSISLSILWMMPKMQLFLSGSGEAGRICCRLFHRRCKPLGGALHPRADGGCHPHRLCRCDRRYGGGARTREGSLCRQRKKRTGAAAYFPPCLREKRECIPSRNRGNHKKGGGAVKKLRVGTRKSLLSARQTELALAALAKVHPALETEIVPFTQEGI